MGDMHLFMKHYGLQLNTAIIRLDYHVKIFLWYFTLGHILCPWHLRDTLTKYQPRTDQDCKYTRTLNISRSTTRVYNILGNALLLHSCARAQLPREGRSSKLTKHRQAVIRKPASSSAEALLIKPLDVVQSQASRVARQKQTQSQTVWNFFCKHDKEKQSDETKTKLSDHLILHQHQVGNDCHLKVCFQTTQDYISLVFSSRS